MTFDGLAYSLQTVGEHVLVESDDGSIVVQSRHEPTGASTKVSMVTSVAAQLTEYSVVIEAGGSVTIGGHPLVMESGQFVPLIDGAAVFRDGSTYTLAWPGESDERFRLVVKTYSNHLTITPFLPPAQAGSVSGLLGDADGNTGNDLALRDGATLSQPISSTTLYGPYADSWRITQNESLFEYGPGESTETFTEKGSTR